MACARMHASCACSAGLGTGRGRIVSSKPIRLASPPSNAAAEGPAGLHAQNAQSTTHNVQSIEYQMGARDEHAADARRNTREQRSTCAILYDILRRARRRSAVGAQRKSEPTSTSPYFMPRALYCTPRILSATVPTFRQSCSPLCICKLIFPSAHRTVRSQRWPSSRSTYRIAVQ